MSKKYLPLKDNEAEALVRLLIRAQGLYHEADPDKDRLMELLDRVRTGLLDQVPGGNTSSRSITGTVSGAVVQCDTVHGGVNMNSTRHYNQ